MGNTSTEGGKRLKILGAAVQGGTQPEVYLDVNLGAGWTGRYRVRDQRGVPVVAELHVFHSKPRSRERRNQELLNELWDGGDAPAAGLGSLRLRDIPVGPAIAERALRELKTWPKEIRRVTGVFGGTANPPRQGSRRSRGKRFYAELAARYLNAYRRDPRRPVVLLAEELGWSRNQVRDALHDARRAGMLTKATPGLGGGGLTNEALTILGTRRGKR